MLVGFTGDYYCKLSNSETSSVLTNGSLGAGGNYLHCRNPLRDLSVCWVSENT